MSAHAPLKYVHEFCKSMCADGRRYLDSDEFQYGLALPPVANDDLQFAHDVLSPQQVETLLALPSPSSPPPDDLTRNAELWSHLKRGDNLQLLQRQVRLMQRERSLFDEALKEATERRKYTVRGFYHVSRWAKYWREVVEEHLHILDGQRQLGNRTDFALQHMKENIANAAAGLPVRGLPWSGSWASLLRASEQLVVNIVGPAALEFDRVRNIVQGLHTIRNRHKLVFHYNKTIPRKFYEGVSKDIQKTLDATAGISEGEYSSIELVHDYCTAAVRQKQPALVYYFHSKGGCCSRYFPGTYSDNYMAPQSQDDKYKTHDPVASWREVMNVFNLEYPSICLRALLKGHPICGFELQDAHYRYYFSLDLEICVTAFIHFYIDTVAISGGPIATILLHCRPCTHGSTPGRWSTGS